MHKHLVMIRSHRLSGGITVALSTLPLVGLALVTLTGKFILVSSSQFTLITRVLNARLWSGGCLFKKSLYITNLYIVALALLIGMILAPTSNPLGCTTQWIDSFGFVLLRCLMRKVTTARPIGAWRHKRVFQWNTEERKKRRGWCQTCVKHNDHKDGARGALTRRKQSFWPLGVVRCTSVVLEMMAKGLRKQQRE